MRRISRKILLVILISVIVIPIIAYSYYQLILSDSYTLSVLVIDDKGNTVPDATVQVFVTIPEGPVKLLDQLKTNNCGEAKFHFSITSLTKSWVETNKWLTEHSGIANPGILVFAYYTNGEKLGTATHTLTIPWEIRGKGPISIEKKIQLKWNTSISKVKTTFHKAGFTPKEQAPTLKYVLAWSEEEDAYINLAYLKTDSHSKGTLDCKIYKYDYLAYKVTINEGGKGWESLKKKEKASELSLRE